MPLLPQDIVHKIEVGVGARAVRIALAVLAVLFLFVGYNWRAYKNFSTQEAMDSAQLARNIASGEGYTTKFIRPFSMFLIKQANQGRLDSLTPAQRADLCEVKGNHPDIANPPVYPLVLAGLMKAHLLPETTDLQKDRPFWWSGGVFMRSPQDFIIAVFNECLLLVLAWLTFLVARRLFDTQVAWLSAALLVLTDLFWKFSVSGLSTMLLLVLFMALVWMLIRFEAAARAPTDGAKTVLWYAALIGALLGVGMLTRYSYGFLALPVLGLVVAIGGRWRVPAALLIVGVFAAIVIPWVVRNLQVSGTPFGTVGFALIDNSVFFPGHRLDRSLHPDLSQIRLSALWWKFFINLRQIITNELPRLGGSVIPAFFLVGLMFGFRNPAITRIRYFTLAALATLMVVQALGRTALSDDSPDINSENLIVLILPLLLVFGVSFFLTLLDQIPMPFSWVRGVVIVLFGGLASLPIIFSLLPPRTQPVAFPPYHPPSIQLISSWMGKNELVMSDVPWAVAWYGNRQSVLRTVDVLGAHSEFYQLNDYIKPVRALYLTPRSLDAKFLSQWMLNSTERTWGTLILMALKNEVLPPRFPLNKSPKTVRLPEQLFLSDWERWLKVDKPAETP